MRFAENHALETDLGGEIMMFGWVDIGDAASKDGDRATLVGERRAMGDAVDTAGESTHDGEAGLS